MARPLDRRRLAPLATLLALGLVALGFACLEGHGDRPEGSRCSSDSDCRDGLRCEYGRCRAECTIDRDCGENGRCVPAESGGGMVCVREGEACTPGSCPPGFECVDGECVETPADGDGDADLDGDAEIGDADGDGDEPVVEGPCLDLGLGADATATIASCDGDPVGDSVPLEDLPALLLSRHGELSVQLSGTFVLVTEPCEGSILGAPACRVDVGDSLHLCVLVAGSFELNAGAVLRANGPRPLVIISRESIRIDGDLDASALGTEPGPGGGQNAPDDARRGPCPGSRSTCAADPCGGGGGGGMAQAGGDGGCDDGAPGGPSCADCGRRELLGGSSGGEGHTVDMTGGARGGGGGGALYLLSYSDIEVSALGAVLARGGRGMDGGELVTGGPAGGGSGGTIVLEAPSVDVEGEVSVAGGRGGDVTRGASIAAQGGEGGVADDSPANGACEPGAVSGGGGSAGRIFVRGRLEAPVESEIALGSCGEEAFACSPP